MMEYTEYIPEQEDSMQTRTTEAKTQVEREVIDSLPYIDSYDADAESQAQAMVEAELRTFPNPHPASGVAVSFTVRKRNDVSTKPYFIRFDSPWLT